MRACWRSATGSATGRGTPTVVGLHGLEGSSRAHYMRGLADKAFAGGFNVVLLNQRNCGGTEHLSKGLYHSGLTHDARVRSSELIDVDRLPAIAVVGYSLGGNLTLKLAGDYGDAPPRELVAVCAVSPTMDLAVCVKALEQRENVIYQWNFVRNLKNRMRRKAALFPASVDLKPLANVWSVRGFDEALHGAASWLSRRGRLLLPRECAAGDRQGARAGADHRVGQRSVRARRAVPAARGHGQSARHRWRSRATAAIARSSPRRRSAL